MLTTHLATHGVLIVGRVGLGEAALGLLCVVGLVLWVAVLLLFRREQR